jgi:hypothetical protein
MITKDGFHEALERVLEQLNTYVLSFQPWKETEKEGQGKGAAKNTVTSRNTRLTATVLKGQTIPSNITYLLCLRLHAEDAVQFLTHFHKKNAKFVFVIILQFTRTERPAVWTCM